MRSKNGAKRLFFISQPTLYHKRAKKSILKSKKNIFFSNSTKRSRFKQKKSAYFVYFSHIKKINRPCKKQNFVVEYMINTSGDHNSPLLKIKQNKCNFAFIVKSRRAKTTKCCFYEAETAQSKERAEPRASESDEAIERDYATVETYNNPL